MKIYRFLCLVLCVFIISGCETKVEDYSKKKYKITKIEELSNLPVEKDSNLSSGVVNNNKFYFQSSRIDPKYNVSKDDKIFSYDISKRDLKELNVDYLYTTFEFVEFEGSYIYTEVIPGENETEPFTFKVIEEKDHVKKVLNEGIMYSWPALPRYTIHKNKLYTIITKIIPIENYTIDEKANLDYALMCYEKGSLKRVYGKTQEINNSNLNEDASMLGSTWFNTAVSDNMLMIYEQNKNSSLIHYLIDDEWHEYKVPFVVVEALAFDDYIILQNEDKKTKILNIHNQKISDFDYEGAINSSEYIGDNSRIYFNDAGIIRVMHINKDGKAEYLYIDLDKDDHIGYPDCYNTKEGIIIQYGLDHYMLTIDKD
ncbi:MAG: hypothetical protein RR959_03520 [Erysipelotrichaceae bacterium]